MINARNMFLFDMPGGTEWILIIIMFFFVPVFLFVIVYYLTNSTRRKTLFGRIVKEFVVALLVWIVIAVLLVAYGEGNRFLLLFWICLSPFGYLLYLINLYWLIPVFERKKKKVATYVVELLATAIIVVFPFWGIAAYINNGHSLDMLVLLFVAALIISLSITWYIYLRNRDRIRQLFSLKKELGRKTSNLQFLRSQINPHFLFNALNTLYGMAIKENAVRTGDGIQRLGDMMRFMLRDNEKDRIPLTGEISYLKDYIYIQQLRLADSENIQLTVNIREPESEYAIVPMLLVPFVENAFKHGVRLQTKSWISLDLYVEDGVLYFEVRNSVHPKVQADTERTSTGIGLENVKERLILLYPGRHHLKMNQNETENIVQFTLTL